MFVTSSPVKAEPYREAEISFNVDTSKLAAGEYRIALDCGQSKVYGGFYIKGHGIAITAECTEEKPVSGSFSLDCDIINSGTDSARVISAKLMRGDTPVGVPSEPMDGLLAAGEKRHITFISDKPLSAGDYYAEFDCGQIVKSSTVTINDGSDADRYMFGGKADAKLGKDKLTVSVTAGSTPQDPVTIGWLEIKTDEGWQRTIYTPEYRKAQITKGKNNIIFIPETMLDENRDEIKELYDDIMKHIDEALESGELEEDDLKEVEQIKAMDITEFSYYFILGFIPVEPQTGMKGRLMVGDEYVYFTVK